MRIPDRKVPGRCLVFCWGPPWTWKPSFERSKYHAGWSLTWLWWGIDWLPISITTLRCNGIYARCENCERFTMGKPRSERIVGDRTLLVCERCQREIDQ